MIYYIQCMFHLAWSSKKIVILQRSLGTQTMDRGLVKINTDNLQIFVGACKNRNRNIRLENYIRLHAYIPRKSWHIITLIIFTMDIHSNISKRGRGGNKSYFGITMHQSASNLLCSMAELLSVYDKRNSVFGIRTRSKFCIKSTKILLRILLISCYPITSGRYYTDDMSTEISV